MSQIFVIHENPNWLTPFSKAFHFRNEKFADWNLISRSIDLSSNPPEGIFYNRMSASAHSRGHRYSPELAGILIGWLEDNNRRVINSTRALQLEISKAAQLTALASYDIPVPRTITANTNDEVLNAVRKFSPRPVILKPNRGGKGLGVRLFHDTSIIEELLLAKAIEKSVDGVTLVQEYIAPYDGSITRAEFIGGEFLYAVKVDTRNGFELCPADYCGVEDEKSARKFEIIRSIPVSLRDRLKAFLKHNNIEVAGVEFVTDQNGNDLVFDVNTNTNYNDAAEKVAGVNAPLALVDFLISERKLNYPTIS
ncbi:MAG: alpha-L-glutamate ligase [Rhodospirillaceae bacterium]|nr:alpha-L-glutamate ligase [Rhodospirillaceae bacterium]|tara:strand:+ start:702 stop:1628 length:927 start_codon:yes stop_codon:yes gene_type:complete